MAIAVYGIFNRRGYGRALALSGATPVGAALLIGSIAVPTFYAVAVGAAVGVMLRLLASSTNHNHIPVPSSRALVLLLVVGVLVTLVSPLLFAGTYVQTPLGGMRLTPGVVTKSNIAQVFYLTLSVAVVAYLARSGWTRAELVGTATCLTTILSFWSWAHASAGLPFPEDLFDNSPAFAFQETLPGGAPRVRGILSEPAGLATSCLVTISYCSSRIAYVRGARRLGLLVMMAAAVYLGSISTSTTFVVAGLALLIVASVTAALTFIIRGGALRPSTATALCVLSIGLLFLLPVIANVVGQQVNDKVGSSSYIDRSSADVMAYQLALDTFGIGTGLGSSRASSLLSTLLSTVGVIGTLLFSAAVIIVIRRGWSVRPARPAAWALIALLMAKVVSGPDLSDNSGVLWMSLGVLAHAALQAERQRGSDGSPLTRVGRREGKSNGPAGQ